MYFISTYSETVLMELSDKEWELIEPVLPILPSGIRGRPWRNNREVWEGILWLLRTGNVLSGFTRCVSTLPNMPSSFAAMVL